MEPENLVVDRCDKNTLSKYYLLVTAATAEGCKNSS